MKLKQFFCVGLFGLALTSFVPETGFAQNLKVTNQSTARKLNVAINSAVVVESDVPFAELSVANPAIADIATLSDRTIYVLGKSPGRTTLTLLGPDGRLITNVSVRVSPDLSEFKERLREILPGEKIEVRTANDGLVLSGTVSSIAKLDRALDLAERYAPDAVSNLMSVGGTQQVMLKVRFAEMRRSVSKDLSASLGFQTAGGTFGANGFTNTLQAGNNPTTTFPAGGGAGNAVSTRERNGVFSFGFGSGSLRALVVLEALETKGLVRTLAEPNLTALSGQEATFLAGGEYPIPVVDDGTVSISYKPFGVELKFTPTVLDEDIINLKLDTAVSGIDSTVVVQNEGFAVNAFSKRASSTVVEMRDGESFAIAGLLEDDFTDLAGQVPWLGDIPILGALFRSANFERRQSELVVIVTAHLVSPTRGNALVLSTDRIRPPTEREFFLNGKVAREVRTRRTSTGEVARQDFSGSYGYVLE
ncbi:pilus assembly protein CpaC [Litoreibacter halocynthiae]|uniref:Pilus assembly protein CpaC n=2 Tax=Litoreibacter TaxID=947567 RepID=A0A4R7LHH4_9RHOB|nr:MULTISPECIES: type II and III secretion system protein family protein [Litoreibacter]TDT75198.1 pilus assembly protein CpaC [Litoreibacter halocynthiae]SHF02112.1 pilus assembly protein CpaC [Litoreibacter ascidiaceicola]